MNRRFLAILLLALTLAPLVLAQTTIWRGIESGYLWSSRADRGTGKDCPTNQCVVSSTQCTSPAKPYVGGVPMGDSTSAWICADTPESPAGLASYRCGIDDNGWPNKVGKTLYDSYTKTNWCCAYYFNDNYVFTAGKCADVLDMGVCDYVFEPDLLVMKSCSNPGNRNQDQVNVSVEI